MATRDKWDPTKNSAVCRKSFTPGSVFRLLVLSPLQKLVFRLVRTQDDFEIAAVKDKSRNSQSAVRYMIFAFKLSVINQRFFSALSGSKVFYTCRVCLVLLYCRVLNA